MNTMIEINSESKLTIKGCSKVTFYSTINIVGTNTYLDIEHVADFSGIPIELHEIYLNSFKYSVIDNNVYGDTKQYYPMSVKQVSSINKFFSGIFKRLKKYFI